MLIVFPPGCKNEKPQGVGINYQATKYEVGDKFQNGKTIWELVEWKFIYEDTLRGINIYRWKIRIDYVDIVAEAWTDDLWLDRLEQIY